MFDGCDGGDGEDNDAGDGGLFSRLLFPLDLILFQLWPQLDCFSHSIGMFITKL